MSFVRGLAYALRSLSRSPALTVALLATIAVGTGTHAALTGFVNGLLTRTLAIPDAGDLVVVAPADEHELPSTSAFESLGTFRETRANVVIDGRPISMTVMTASPGLWDVLRVPPAAGQMKDAIVSYRVWSDVFHGRGDLDNVSLTVNGRLWRVAGVAPEWFDGIYFGRGVDAWITVPSGMDGEAAGGTAEVLARLAPGRGLEDARRSLPGRSVIRYTGVEPEIAVKMARVERVLTWAAALVFATAGANVAGFLLSRASRRSHETAARIALGASARDIAQLVLADALVICVCGGALGALVAFWTVEAFPALLFLEDAERLRFAPSVAPIARSAAGYSVLMLVCALAPLLRLRHDGPLTILRRSGSAQVTSSGGVRSGLVIAQMAVCCVLVIGAAFLIEGFRQSLRSARADRLGDPIVVALDAGGSYGLEADGAAFFRRADAEIRRVPGVTSAAWIATLPGGRPWEQPVRFEPPGPAMREISIDARLFPSGRGINDLELKAGRLFGGVDGPGTCPVAIVNEAAAARYFGGDAVGRSLQDPSGRRIDIVGVVERRRPPQDSEPFVYFFERQAPESMPDETRHLPFRLRPLPPPAPLVGVAWNVASAGYFDAVGASVQSGAVFPPQPQPGSCDTVVVNAEAAQMFFGGDAVGGAVIEPDGHRAEIVGVVDPGVLRVTERRAPPMVFYSSAERYLPRMTLVAGTQKATAELLAEAERRLRATAGGTLTRPVTTLDDHLSRTSLGPERIATMLVAASAVIALGLGLLGVYGVMADTVRQKKREIAVRLALGAQGWTIVAQVLRGGLGLAARGAAAGIVAAWLFVQAIVHAAPGFGLPAAWMWLACPLILTLVVSVASILPARYALAVNPLTLTREE